VFCSNKIGVKLADFSDTTNSTLSFYFVAGDSLSSPWLIIVFLGRPGRS